jgi:hypothetical protein
MGILVKSIEFRPVSWPCLRNLHSQSCMLAS